MKHKAKLTISRPQYGDNRRKISMSIEDANAHIKFLQLEIDLDNFTEALTGLANVECDMEFQHLDVVGKVRENKTIEFVLPDEADYSNSKQRAIKEAKKYTPDGWVADEYYGSQRSFFWKQLDDYKQEKWARTSIVRWVDKKENCDG